LNKSSQSYGIRSHGTECLLLPD